MQRIRKYDLLISLIVITAVLMFFIFIPEKKYSVPHKAEKVNVNIKTNSRHYLTLKDTISSFCVRVNLNLVI